MCFGALNGSLHTPPKLYIFTVVSIFRHCGVLKDCSFKAGMVYKIKKKKIMLLLASFSTTLGARALCF